MSAKSPGKIVASPEEGGQLLFQAAVYNNRELLIDLLQGDFKSQLNWTDSTKGRTSLHAAASAGYGKCVELLLQNGADVNCTSNAYDGYKTPLHLAAESGHVECVKLLVKYGADVFATDRRGYSALETAQMAEEQKAACAIIDTIEEINEKIDEQRMKVEKACIEGNIENLRQILNAADKSIVCDLVNGNNNEQYTPLYRASERGHLKLVELLIGHGAEARVHPATLYSPLYIAAYAGHVEVLEVLLKHFPHLTRMSTCEGWLPLHAACKIGNTAVVNLLLHYDYPDIVYQTYTDSGGHKTYRFPFDLNGQDSECKTPLFLACIQGNLEVVQILLEFILAEEKGDASSDKPGHAYPIAGYEDVLSKDLAAIDEQSQAQFTFAQSMRNSPAGQNIEGQSTPSPPVVTCTPVKRSRSKLNTVSKTSPRKIQVEKHSFRPVEVDVYGNNGRTPLQVAIAGGHREVALYLVVEGGSNVNLPLAVTDEEIAQINQDGVDTGAGEVLLHCAGSGALIEACKQSDVELVTVLLDHGASDHDNKALSIALNDKQDKICEKLLCQLVFSDPEYRVYRKGVDAEVLLGRGRAVVPSSLYPSVASMVNWNGAGLTNVTEVWIYKAALHLNPKMRSSLNSPNLIYSSITRLDLSTNNLTSLPLAIFQLPSVRIMNLARNRLKTLPTTYIDGNGRPQTQYKWHCPVLEELHLDKNMFEELNEELFTWLPSLQALSASHNLLKTLPNLVWFARKLKDLNVSHNLLSTLPAALHQNMRQDELNINDIESDAMGGDSPLSRNSRRSIVSMGEDPLTGNASEVSETAHSLMGDAHLSVQELNRHNLWQKSVELSRVLDDDDVGEVRGTAWPQASRLDPMCNPYAAHADVNLAISRKRTGKSLLSNLNLCNNRFDRVPECLSCVAPNLSRLNMAENELSELGPVTSYPPRLKHLDVSRNEIVKWFTPPRGHMDLVCYSASPTVGISPGGVQRSHSPAGRRSHSTKRGQRSVSVSRNADSMLSLSAAVTGNANTPICPHKTHMRLDNLRTLVLCGNNVKYINLGVEQSHNRASVDSKHSETASTPSSRRAARKSVSSVAESPSNAEFNVRVVFPLLTMLDVSDNPPLSCIPANIGDLSCLSVFNLSKNPGISVLPPEVGLLCKLWNLNVQGCNLGEPLKSMMDSRKYKTMDIVGYLKSVLEDSKPYARMKLMIVGIQGIGKTSLLEQLRLEGTVSNRKGQHDGWAKRMGHKDVNKKTNKGSNISTVGVDVGDWTFEPKKSKQQPTYGPVTFRTWDFGGQREYYATHQYFLSRRSLYIVVWRITDGEAGINEIWQWLVNIQARAPNSPVVIVGTHFDEILANSKKFPNSFVDDLQQIIRDRFVLVQDADKKGLPRVVDSVIVSSKSRYNIRHLCNLIYSTAFEQRSAGSKERLLEQMIPATYLALEEVVTVIADERKAKGKDPVVTADQYRLLVKERMKSQFGKTFRDNAELNQATAFLHENGVLLHYDDATLKELYFLDPQWLCDILAHVITIREINPFAKNGLMRLDDLKFLFKSSRFSPVNIRSYILNLLQKFEVALTWDNCSLLIPSLLPDEYILRGGYTDATVKIPVKCKGWTIPSMRIAKEITIESDPTNQTNTPASPSKTMMPIFTLHKPGAHGQVQGTRETVKDYSIHWVPNGSVRRIYMMSYVPSGFWSRLMTRVLGDDQVSGIIDSYFSFVDQKLGNFDYEQFADKRVKQICHENRPHWTLWQTGCEVSAFGGLLLCMKEFLPMAEIRDVNYTDLEWPSYFEGCWRGLAVDRSSVIELYLPVGTVNLSYKPPESSQDVVVSFEISKQSMARLLALLVDVIDTLLEDWYPSLGTRFVHTSEGRLLVSRLAPCPKCVQLHTRKGDEKSDQDWTILGDDKEESKNKIERSQTFDVSKEDLSPGNMAKAQQSDKLRSQSIYDVHAQAGDAELLKSKKVYSFTIEQCILSAHNDEKPKCPVHTQIDVEDLAPDAVFLDISGDYLIRPEQVKRGKMLGRGAFGFVFKACIRTMDSLQETGPSLEEKENGMSPSSKSPSSPSTFAFVDKIKNLLRNKSPGRKEKNKKRFGVTTLDESPCTQAVDVALKMLQPVDPGFGAKQSAVTAYKAAWTKWQRDPPQYSCKAYCTARQELNILRGLKHPNVVSLIGVCPRPLALVVALAPLGALGSLLKNYRRSGARLQLSVLQECAVQVSRALEYLHQQHIIYRDLKSENVLVWRFPPPFSDITDVEVRLGDYGISRSVFPSGGAKGFGGTEGFMAPEIMKYNGEEEYTEKVDCFSFSMFLYELISLKLPFEGHEQVKEFILEGGRPQLTPSELLYPCNVLDAMVVGWAVQPSDRPSASQLVSLCSAPEFAHLLDVVSLNDSDAAVLSGEAFSIDDCVSDDGVVEPGLEGEVWLSRADGQVSILSCNQNGWLDYKNIYVNDDSFVTAMCLVEDTVWMGELTGLIRVFCAKNYTELYSFALAPHVLTSESPRTQLSLPIATILSVSSLRLVLIATAQPGALLLCRMLDNLGAVGDPVIASIRLHMMEINCATALPPVDGFVEVWVGHLTDQISIFEASEMEIKEKTMLAHYDPPVEGVDVHNLVSSKDDPSYVWSYVYPGSVLYQWSVKDRAIIAKLDCSKIAPCSESISTISIDEKLSPGRCQVTAVCLLEREDGTQLYIGTTWGVVIVTQAHMLQPITAFRPHLEEIRVIQPVSAAKRAAILQRLTGNWNTKQSAGSYNTEGKRDSAVYTNSSKQSGQVSKDTHEKGQKGDSFVLTAGKGYRCLVQRFVDNYRDDAQVLDSRNKDYFAIMWRTDDWVH